ncbi:MAG: hypothetical protein IKH61_12600 [Bacteroidales bacterium]|nr:hypothetical protein [Bacteroidales bacterium]
MSKTEKEILDIMNNSDVICTDKEQLDSFEKALESFNELINRGLVKSRGYNLQTIEDYGNSLAFNVMA